MSQDEEIEAAAALLESIVDDPGKLADIDPDLRRRLMIAAGKVSRPDAASRRRFRRARKRVEKAARKNADQGLQALVDEHPDCVNVHSHIIGLPLVDNIVLVPKYASHHLWCHPTVCAYLICLRRSISLDILGSAQVRQLNDPPVTLSIRLSYFVQQHVCALQVSVHNAKCVQVRQSANYLSRQVTQ